MAAPAIYVILAPEERNAGTPPQSKSSAQPGHRSHLLHSNQILFYTISIALVGMGHIGQMSDFLAAVIEEAGSLLEALSDPTICNHSRPAFLFL